jgi:hypothetical protein
MRSFRGLLLPGQHGLPSISLSCNPLTDIRVAIHQLNVTRLALREKIDAVLTGQSHIREVENDAAIFPFRDNERFQLGNVLFVDPAAYGKNHIPIFLPLDFQHTITPLLRAGREPNVSL